MNVIWTATANNKQGNITFGLGLDDYCLQGKARNLEQSILNQYCSESCIHLALGTGHRTSSRCCAFPRHAFSDESK